MLENAVFPIQDLRAVKDQASQLQVRLGTTITYDEYCSLLLSAASTYDAQFTTNANSRGTRRSVYGHEITNDHDSTYNIDSDLQLLDINDANGPDTFEVHYSRSSQRPRLTPQQWQQLSQNARNTWNMLDATSKNIILGHETTQRQ